jgi:hypothetical protein
MTNGLALGVQALLIPVLAGCASPEAVRTRGGGPGADVGNHGQAVELHAGAEPYFKTRCVQEVECDGPLPVFGPTSRVD